MSYSFFFSYASEDDRNSQGRVRWFFDRLYERLQLAHGRVEKPFFAPRGIEAGANWRQILETALNTSKILVCLQSPLYFESAVCGQELEIFLQRRKLYRRTGGEPPDCIIPILWQTLAEFPVPKALPNDFQGKKPSDDLTPFPMDGLYQAILADQTPDKEKILLYALNLAGRMSNLIRKSTGDRALPPLAVAPDLDATPSAFDFPEWPLPDVDKEKATGPTSVTLVYPTGVPPENLPFAPPPPNAVISAAAIAKSREWIYQGVGFNSPADIDDKIAKIKWARDKKSPVLVMLTEALLGDRELLTRLSQLEQGIGTIVLSTSNTRQLPADFPSNLNATLTTRERFDETVISKVAKLRTAIMAEATTAEPGAIPTF